VVGVAAGAGGYRPGIVFDHRDAGPGSRVAISIMGKAACRADVSFGAIAVGDLLTTSPARGCAMKAPIATRPSAQ
jgi:hypothetical protein